MAWTPTRAPYRGLAFTVLLMTSLLESGKQSARSLRIMNKLLIALPRDSPLRHSPMAMSIMMDIKERRERNLTRAIRVATTSQTMKAIIHYLTRG
jgi:hypothetical protein